jgi:hypothetical protein
MMRIGDPLVRIAAFEHVQRLGELRDHLTARLCWSRGFSSTVSAFRSTIPARYFQTEADAVPAIDQDGIPEAGRQGLV